MTTLFNVDFENGKLFDRGPSGKGFDLVSVTGGSIACLEAAKYEGAYGCAITPLSGYNVGGARMIHNPSSGKFRQRFYLHPNGITTGTSQYLMIARNYHYDLSQIMYAVYLNWNGSSHTISTGMGDNNFGGVTVYSPSDYTITNAWHRIETYWQRGTPGSFQLWIDGVSKATITETNNLCWVITPGLGKLRGDSLTVSGSFYVDKWAANDDGAEIGA